MLKSLKFGVSITLLLVSVALVLRALDAPPRWRVGIAWTLASAMFVELVIIVGQALRGRASHWNVSTPLDAALWHVMAGAIVVAVGALAVLAVMASTHALQFDPLIAAAVRIGLWVVLLVAVSGFAMGGRGANSVAPAGDLRVPHFFALHGLQALPLVAMVLLKIPAGDRTRWTLLIAAAAIWIAISIGTLAQAFAGRSFVGEA